MAIDATYPPDGATVLTKTAFADAIVRRPGAMYLFDVPAGSIIDTETGRLRVTEPNGCRYLLKRVNAAWPGGEPTMTLTASMTP